MVITNLLWKLKAVDAKLFRCEVALCLYRFQFLRQAYLIKSVMHKAVKNMNFCG